MKARGSDITSNGVTISDVEFHAGPLDYLTKASLKLQWGGETVWCVHEPLKQQKCNNIDGKTNNDYSLELVDKAMFLHTSVTRLVVSHKGEQRSFSLKVSCGDKVRSFPLLSLTLASKLIYDFSTVLLSREVPLSDPGYCFTSSTAKPRYYIL